jgi:hypothetical protein
MPTMNQERFDMKDYKWIVMEKRRKDAIVTKKEVRTPQVRSYNTTGQYEFVLREKEAARLKFSGILQ